MVNILEFIMVRIALSSERLNGCHRFTLPLKIPFSKPSAGMAALSKSIANGRIDAPLRPIKASQIFWFTLISSLKMDFKSAMQAFAEAWTAANGYQRQNYAGEQNKSSEKPENENVEAEGEVEGALGREGTRVMVPLNSNSSKNLADTFFSDLMGV